MYRRVRRFAAFVAVLALAASPGAAHAAGASGTATARIVAADPGETGGAVVALRERAARPGAVALRPGRHVARGGARLDGDATRAGTVELAGGGRYTIRLHTSGTPIEALALDARERGSNLRIRRTGGAALHATVPQGAGPIRLRLIAVLHVPADTPAGEHHLPVRTERARLTAR